MEVKENTTIIKPEDLVESENNFNRQKQNEVPSHQKEIFLSRLLSKRSYSIFYILFGVGGLLAIILIKLLNYSEPFSKEFAVEVFLLISSILLIHGIADTFSKDELVNEVIKTTQETLTPIDDKINEINNKIQTIGNEKYLSGLKPSIQNQIKKSLQNVI